MTVSELIELLKDMPDYAELTVGSSRGLRDIEDVVEDSIEEVVIIVLR